jgi:NAD(P)-dependent dehydrogenase (short-subunit alcohol dehydrogenase family)
MKTALITGANKGIGFEAARQLAQQNIFVYLGCRRSEAGLQAVNTLHAEGLTHTAFVELDVTSDESVKKAKEFIEQKSGSLDVLVNNAGILNVIPEPGKSVPLKEIQRVFDTNFFGVIRVTQEFFPLLQKSSAPRIVNVTSDLASLTLNSDPSWKYYQFKSTAYGPSKSALNAYTVTLAHQLINTSFKINAVNPGYTATDFNNYRGTLTPQHAAKVIVTYATIGEEGPTGKYLGEEGEVPW